MNQEMDWEEYEQILMQRPGFKEALEETRLEYEIARAKIKARIRGRRFQAEIKKLVDSLELVKGSMKLIDQEQEPDKLIISNLL